MADFDAVQEDAVGGVDGNEVVDIAPDGTELDPRAVLRDILLSQFDKVLVDVVNQQGLIGKAVLAQCKICGALLQRDIGVGLIHANYHRHH